MQIIILIKSLSHFQDVKKKIDHDMSLTKRKFLFTYCFFRSLIPLSFLLHSHFFLFLCYLLIHLGVFGWNSEINQHFIPKLCVFKQSELFGCWKSSWFKYLLEAAAINKKLPGQYCAAEISFGRSPSFLYAAATSSEQKNVLSSSIFSTSMFVEYFFISFLGATLYFFPTAL